MNDQRSSSSEIKDDAASNRRAPPPRYGGLPTIKGSHIKKLINTPILAKGKSSHDSPSGKDVEDLLFWILGWIFTTIFAFLPFLFKWHQIYKQTELENIEYIFGSDGILVLSFSLIISFLVSSFIEVRKNGIDGGFVNKFLFCALFLFGLLILVYSSFEYGFSVSGMTVNKGGDKVYILTSVSKTHIVNTIILVLSLGTGFLVNVSARIPME